MKHADRPIFDRWIFPVHIGFIVRVVRYPPRTEIVVSRRTNEPLAQKCIGPGHRSDLTVTVK